MSAHEGIRVNDRIYRGNLILGEKPPLPDENVHVLGENELHINDELRCLVLESGIATPIFYTRSELKAAGVELQNDSDVQRWSLVFPETEENMATVAPERRNARDLVLAVLKKLDPIGEHYDRQES